MLPFKYIRRSLYQRKNSTLAAVAGSALVVVVFAAALMIPQGIEQVSSHSKHADVALVMSVGASTETESALDEEAARGAVSAKEVSRGADGQPAAAPEVITTVLMEKVGAQQSGRTAEVLVRVRGLTAQSLALRPEVKVIAGRLPTPGTEEAMVGRALRGHFKGLEIGEGFQLKQGRPAKIVGVFDAGGSLDESEVFADANVVRSATGKEGLYSSVRVKVDPDRFVAYKTAIESQKQLGVEVRRETEFVAAQYGPQTAMMQALGLSVSFFFGLGGIIGALITMHSAVANRSREIGTLRALGFSRFTVLSCIVIESILLTFVGGAIGALIAVSLGRVEISVINVLTLSEMVFQLQATPSLILAAMAFSIVLGLVGGLLPALEAARMRPVDAMRK